MMRFCLLHISTHWRQAPTQLPVFLLKFQCLASVPQALKYLLSGLIYEMDFKGSCRKQQSPWIAKEIFEDERESWPGLGTEVGDIEGDENRLWSNPEGSGNSVSALTFWGSGPGRNPRLQAKCPHLLWQAGTWVPAAMLAPGQSLKQQNTKKP